MFARLNTCVAAVLFTLVLAAHSQNTIHVPADQPTIQAGINAAANGDTVLVAPGTYYENIDFEGKAIALTSSGGAAGTIIDGRHLGSTVSFQTNEVRSSVISGFTIRNGQVPYTGFPTNEGGKPGGGVLAYESAPTILNNVITSNYCTGVNSYYGAPLISGNTVSLTDDTPAQCMFQYNAPIAALGLTKGTSLPADLVPTVIGNIIENNNLEGYATSEQTAASGAAVILGPAVFQNNILRNNKQILSGGALRLDGPSTSSSIPVIASGNLIYQNSSACGASGITLGFFSPSQQGSPLLYVTNNTIADNVASGTACDTSSDASQVSTYWNSNQSVFTNNIITGISSTIPVIDCVERPDSFPSPNTGSAFFDYNDFYNASGPAVGSGCTDKFSSGNLYTNPLFEGQASGDYHLVIASPLVDAGNNSTGPLLPYDLDGQTRIQNAKGKGCIIDIGAYEYSGVGTACSIVETLQSSLNPSFFGQPVTFTAQLSSQNEVPTGNVQFADGGTILGTVAVSSAGTAFYTMSTLTTGSHNIIATFQPTGIFSGTSASLTQLVNGNATSSVLTSSLNPSTRNQPVTFTAHVTSSNGIPTGSVQFSDGATILGTQPLDNTGAASLSTATLTLGQHTITATYQPTGSFASSSNSVTQQVNGLPTNSALTYLPTSPVAGTPMTLTATVTSTLGGTPSGTVTFSNNGLAFGTPVPVTNGTATLPVASAPFGNNNFACSYSGDSTFSPSNCPPVNVYVSAEPTATTLVSSNNPSFALAPVTFTASLTANGQPSNGGNHFFLDSKYYPGGTAGPNGTTLIQMTLAAGSHTIEAEFAGTDSMGYSNAFVTQIVSPNMTATTLNASAGPFYQNQLITITAALKDLTGSVQPYGTIAVSEGASVLATLPYAVSATSPVASFGIASLAPGTHILVATYTPADGNFLASTAVPLSITIAPQTFTLSLSAPTISVPTEHHASFTASLQSLGGFAGPVQLSCATPPQNTYLTCEMLNPQIQLTANATETTSITMDTDAVLGFKADLGSTPAQPNSHRETLCFALLLPLSLAGLTWRRRLRAVPCLLAIAILAGVASLAGCSSQYPAHTQPGTYVIPITATGTAQGSSTSITQTIDLTLVVTP